MAQGPLTGCRVVELARFVTGPFASQLLADLGAEVIKIEDPEEGDPFRGWGAERYGAPFVAFNRSKRSLTLNLRRPEAMEAFHRLIKDADVFIENFRPGVTAKMGIDYASLSARYPRLVYCSITGMGPDGPYAQRPSYDIVGQGLSGLLSLLVDTKDPKPVGPTFSDTLTGLFAAYGILAAMQGRERTGRGQLVETNLLQATMGFMHEPYATLSSGRSPDAFSRPRQSLVFAFICGDGLPLAVHLSSPPKFWEAFVTAAGHAEMLDDPRFKTHRDRQDNWQLVHDQLAPAFRTRPRAEWFDILVKADVPASPVYRLEEAAQDPQVRHLGMLKTLQHPVRGEVKVVGFPVTLSSTSLGPLTAPPMLGEHTAAVLGELGFSEEQVANLKKCNAI